MSSDIPALPQELFANPNSETTTATVQIVDDSVTLITNVEFSPLNDWMRVYRVLILPFSNDGSGTMLVLSIAVKNRSGVLTLTTNEQANPMTGDINMASTVTLNGNSMDISVADTSIGAKNYPCYAQITEEVAVDF